MSCDSGSWAGRRPRLGGYVTGTGPRVGCPPEGVEVAYPRKILLVVAFAAPLAAEAPRRALLTGSVGQIASGRRAV